MVEETRQTLGHKVQRDLAGSSAFSAKKSFGANKQKHIKTDNSENKQKNDKLPGKCKSVKK